jgi:hypothetical protein
MKTSNAKISCLALATALLLMGAFISCSKKHSSGPSGPPPPSNPGGYDSSNQIAGLVAYWSFNGNANDTKGGLNGTSSGTAYTSGFISNTQALKGSSNGFVLVNNAGSTIPTLTSWSISFWMNSAQVDSEAQGIFNLILDSASSGGWPYLDVDLEGWHSTSDTINAKIYMRNGNYPWAGQSFQVYLDTAVNKWTHVVFTFNGGNSTITAYENGVSAGMFNYPYGPSQNPPTTNLGPLTIYGNDPGAATGNPNGAPLWTSTFKGAGGIVFDDWQTSTVPNSAPASSSGPLGSWAIPYVGALAHFRIYNTALNSSDVKSLYILEKGGF